MTFREKSVRLSSIDSESDLFRITTKKDFTDLTRSIGSLGLINPPLLHDNGTGFGTIYGFRRIQVYRTLGQKSVIARVADPGLSSLEYAKLAVTDNSSQRELNWVEQSNAVNLLSRFSDGQGQLHNILSELGLPAGASFVNKMLLIYDMPAWLKDGILADGISLPVAIKLKETEETGAQVLSDIFRELNLSLNKQLEILTLVSEISRRDDISIAVLFNEPAIRDILDQDNPERSNVAGLLRGYLKIKRFPEISRAEQEFDAVRKSIKIPKNIQFHAPRYFEGDTYSLQMKFRNMKELNQCRNAIDQIMAHPFMRNRLK
jgi:ParB family transcriptional regulator, chromosome partitioning protein